MKLSAPTNWTASLLDHYATLPVTEVFGAMPTAPIGSARPPSMLPQVDDAGVRQHVVDAHARSLSINYVLNASCLGNLEYDKGVHAQLLDQLAWIDEIGVDAVTVTIPYLAELIKRNFPRLKIKASVIAHIRSVQGARAFEALGVDEINVDYMANRDFKTLAALRKAVSCDLSLLLNDVCLYNCPYRSYHYNLTGHSTQAGHPMEGSYIDYCMIRCTVDKYRHPEELIRARWIRPEDIARYEDLGFEKFKISGRNMTESWLRRAVSAYAARTYPGNLADILSGVSLESTGRVHYYIDNAALDGFLDAYEKHSCDSDCNACTHCRTVAARAVTFRTAEADRLVRSYETMLESLVDGSVFELMES